MGTPGVTVVADPRFRAYDFGPGHPWNPDSRWMAVRLLEAWEAVGALRGPIRWRREVSPAPDEALTRFHTPAYLDRVRACDRRGAGELLDRGDTPSFPGCFDAAARLVEGTLVALGAVADGTTRRAFQPGGGLHHAARDRASGFCIFNDLAVAIATALDQRSYRKVAYVDIDVHHGDGVMYGFYDRGDLLDIDFHETGEVLFPGTGNVEESGRGDGAGLKVNVPLPPGAGDEAFGSLFRRIVPAMLRSFRPDLIVLQCGVDAHAGDGLGHLQYTMASYGSAVRTLRSLADELSGGRLVVTGGGGYHAGHVALVLATVGAALAAGAEDDAAPSELPETWREEFAATIGEPAPRTSREVPTIVRSPWSRERETRLVERLERAIGMRFPGSN